MSDFVQRLDDCPPTLPAPTPADEAPIAVAWFPDIDPKAVRVAHRIRESVSAPRLRAALVAAIVTVTNDLACWQAAQVAAGHETLDAVPALEVDGTSRLVLLWQRAVALHAKAEIVERYRDVDTTGAGERKAEDLDASIGELRRDASHAVRDMLGRSRTCVELI